MTVRQKPRATKPLLATGILLWLFLSGAPAGQAATPDQSLGVDLWQWAIERGGLTLTLLVVGWSYRNSMTKWVDERVALERQLAEAKAAAFDEKLAFQQARVDEAIRYHRSLEGVIGDLKDIIRGNSAALTAHTTALALNTESTNRLANSVQMLDHRLERVEHRE